METIYGWRSEGGRGGVMEVEVEGWEVVLAVEGDGDSMYMGGGAKVEGAVGVGGWMSWWWWSWWWWGGGG